MLSGYELLGTKSTRCNTWIVFTVQSRRPSGFGPGSRCSHSKANIVSLFFKIRQTIGCQKEVCKLAREQLFESRQRSSDTWLDSDTWFRPVGKKREMTVIL